MREINCRASGRNTCPSVKDSNPTFRSGRAAAGQYCILNFPSSDNNGCERIDQRGGSKSTTTSILSTASESSSNTWKIRFH